MSTIKSSAENLTLNADGANNDIKFQSNGSEVAAIDQAGNLTVSGTVDGVDIQTLNTTVNSKAPIADPTFTGTVASIISANNAQGEIAFGDPEDANIGRIAYNHPSNFLATVVNATEYMRIHSNGVTSIPSGVALGVAVSANTASNVLDDYEEGTWTPTLIGTGGGTGTWASSVNTYTKVGRAVHITAYLNCTSLGNMSNAVIIGGLPFTNASAGGYQALATGSATGLAIGAGNCVTAFINVNATTIHPRLWNATTGTAAYGFYIGELSADGSLMLSGTYFAT